MYGKLEHLPQKAKTKVAWLFVYLHNFVCPILRLRIECHLHNSCAPTSLGESRMRYVILGVSAFATKQ